MRMTCPNCDAQYEVPDDVVPVEGRDVQCSNCGQTWFQHHADHAPDAPEEALSPDTVTADEEQAPEPDPASAPEPEPESEPEPEEEEASAPPPTPAAPKAKELDPAVAEILRQEAEAEQTARSVTRNDGLESQPDLGLDDAEGLDEAERRTLEARQRMARMRGEPEPATMSDADVTAAAISSRRDLLPDIDEINSTLRTENDRGTAADGQPQIDAPSETKRKRGFRRGLMLMIILFVLAALLYIYAPRIAAAVPQLEGAMNAYVAMVDQLRLWLDGKVQGVLRWLDKMANASSES